MKTLKRMIISLIVSAFLLGLLPAALAIDGESVLTSVTHINAEPFSLIAGGRTIILAVRNSYTGETLDLTNGLNIDWNRNRYKSVVATPERATINIDGLDTVELTVTYNLLSESEGAERWETVYNVTAVRNDPLPPSFTGTVSKETQYTQDNTIEFTSADFIPKYENIDGEKIGSIAITGSNPTFGSIRVGGADYNLNLHPNIPINTDPVRQGDTIFTFEATSNGTVSYNVSAFAGDDTEEPIGSVVVTILSYKEPSINSQIAESVSKGTVMTFPPSYFTNRCNLYGVPLEAIEITPTNTGFGVWSLGTKTFTAATTIPAAQLTSLTFTANAVGTAAFSWRVITKATPPASGTGSITITSPKLTLLPSEFHSPILRGTTWYIDLDHFSYMPIPTSSQSLLSYIKITAIPAAGDGYLYLSVNLPKNDTYGFPAIAANTALRANAVIPASYVDDLRLATKSAGTSAAVSFKWTATADAKISTAVWAEPVTYTVNFISGGVLPHGYTYYETDMNISLPLAADDISNNFRSVTGYNLSHVTFKLPDKSCGTLYYNYDILKKTGTAVAATTKYYASKSPNLANITFVPAKDYTGTFEITYNAYTESGSYITGQLRFRVNGNAGGTFSYITDKNSPLQLDARDFQAAFLSSTGKSLSYVTFTPLSAAVDGYLCYNHTLAGDYESAVWSGTKYYVNKPQYLSLVTFVPDEDITGRVTVYYTGYSENGTGYSGRLYIYVMDSPGGIVQYSVRENGSAALLADDFSEEFLGVTGSLLSHVTFTPPAAASGSLYFKYDAETGTGTKVTSAVKYYDGKTPDLSDITFVPAKDFTGICVVPYTAYTSGGASYTGKLKFTVFEGSDVISYSTGAGKPVSMKASDFAGAFFMNSDGRTLSYVTFELPSASYGKFFYNYTSPARYDYTVTGSQKFYASAAPYLSNVSFVPQEGYTGSFSVTYTGYTSGGISCTGKIKITVSGSSGGTVSYETNSMTPVTFRTADFVAAFAGKTGSPLYYIRLTQPGSSFGTLYERYNPQYSYNTQVSQANYYYVNNSPFISDITFVPNAGFSGTLAVGYTAYDAYGHSSAGTILITVTSSALGTITYGTSLNRPVLFDSDDLNTVFLSKTGTSLSHVTFTLPPSSAGALYFRYNTSSASAVTSGTKYYRSYSPLLSDISFVPQTGYSGQVTIHYTGYSSGNTAYYGKIIVNVGTNAPYRDMDGHTWAKDAVNYLYSNGIIPDNGSVYFHPGEDMTRGEFMVMIVSAFHLAGAGSGTFPDVPVGSPYYDAVAAAKAYNSAQGDDTGLFHPDWGLTRQDAMVIIVRAFKNTGSPLTPGTMSDLAGFSDASQVSAYAVADMAALVRIGLVQGSAGRLNPKVTFTRAESAVLLYRILTM